MTQKNSSFLCAMPNYSIGRTEIGQRRAFSCNTNLQSSTDSGTTDTRIILVSIVILRITISHTLRTITILATHERLVQFNFLASFVLTPTTAYFTLNGDHTREHVQSYSSFIVYTHSLHCIEVGFRYPLCGKGDLVIDSSI